MPLDENSFPTDTPHCSKCDVDMEPIGSGVSGGDTAYDRWRCPGCKEDLERTF
ncbi:MAG: hypothetical protein J4F28_07240 [Nitrosopumilaceae archaeon]|nr:hypothetical protein [Nitrosopumilaceae archaeon]